MIGVCCSRTAQNQKQVKMEKLREMIKEIEDAKEETHRVAQTHDFAKFCKADDVVIEKTRKLRERVVMLTGIEEDRLKRISAHRDLLTVIDIMDGYAKSIH